MLGLQRLIEQGVPEELCLQLELSNRNGMAVDLIAGWMGDLNEGQKWMDIVRHIAETELDTFEQSMYFPPKFRKKHNLLTCTSNIQRSLGNDELKHPVVHLYGYARCLCPPIDAGGD